MPHQSYCAAVRHTNAKCDCEGYGEYAAQTADHAGNPLFASQVIAEAARQVAATKPRD